MSAVTQQQVSILEKYIVDNFDPDGDSMFCIYPNFENDTMSVEPLQGNGTILNCQLSGSIAKPGLLIHEMAQFGIIKILAGNSVSADLVIQGVNAV